MGGFFMLWDIEKGQKRAKKSKKEDVNVLCSEFAQRYVYIAKII